MVLDPETSIDPRQASPADCRLERGRRRIRPQTGVWRHRIHSSLGSPQWAFELEETLLLKLLTRPEDRGEARRCHWMTYRRRACYRADMLAEAEEVEAVVAVPLVVAASVVHHCSNVWTVVQR